jgi:hypothetical protein
MEHQTEELGLRPPDTAEDTAGGPAEEPGPEPDIPVDVPEETDEPRSATGEPRVDAALARLDELEGLPVTEHRAVFEDVHRRLRDVLGELDTGQPREAGDAAGAASRPGR